MIKVYLSADKAITNKWLRVDNDSTVKKRRVNWCCVMCTRKVSRVHQDLVDIIERVAEITNVTNIRYSVVFGFDDVDSFASGLHKVNINGTRDGVKIKVNILIKRHYKLEDRACFREGYRREFVFYNHVVPIFLEIQRSLITSEGLKYLFPNCILSSTEYDKEVLVMHCFQNFRLFDRFNKMDFSHVSIVVKNLAKLHALSLAADKLYGDKFNDIKQDLSKDVQYSDLNNIPKSLILYFNASVSVVAHPEFKRKLSEVAPYIFLILNKYSTPVSKYNVICHADCWNNNILFKYKGDRPVESIFVDYQLSRFASPVTDISYFLYMSADYDFLSKYYDQLLEIYYGTVSAILRQCNIDIQDTFPRHILQDHLKEYSALGLVEALVSMKIITAESEEAQKMIEMRHQLSNDLHEYETQNQIMFVERVNGIVRFFFERNYSLDGVLIRK